MSIAQEIIDYNVFKQDIDYWIALKGEKKYLEFIKLLKENDEKVYWTIVKDTYRYDKRLLVNIFKYLSFFEEFLRTQIWNISEQTYKAIEEKFLREIIQTIIELKDKICFQEFSIRNLENSKNQINYLRNRVSHNKIILTSKCEGADLKAILISLKNALPQSYQQGFIKDINQCAKGLNITEKLKIII